jgi:hypothetical protein
VIAHIHHMPHMHTWEQLLVAAILVVVSAVALRGTR